IGVAHARQRPRRTTNDTSGTLSYQAMGAPQPGHAERGAHRLRLSGSRAITTFRKLPRTRPKSTTTARGISEGMPRADVPRRRGLQLAKDREVLAHFHDVARVTIREDEPDARLRRERLLLGGPAKFLDGFVGAADDREGAGEQHARDHDARVEHHRAPLHP